MLAAGERGITRWEVVRLDQIVAHVVDQSRFAAATSDIAVQLDLHALTVRGESVLLTQLVTNLVDNAIRYNRPGGTVNLHTSAATGLVVRNTGSVIPAQAVPDLFEPFHRLAGERIGSADGTGLGLSIVRSIAAAHGATASAAANRDGGLSVRIAMPAHGVVAAEPELSGSEVLIRGDV
jgi:signal transduction histidine kinase